MKTTLTFFVLTFTINNFSTLPQSYLNFKKEKTENTVKLTTLKTDIKRSENELLLENYKSLYIEQDYIRYANETELEFLKRVAKINYYNRHNWYYYKRKK